MDQINPDRSTPFEGDFSEESPDGATSAASSSEGHADKISKNQLKRQRRSERWAAKKQREKEEKLQVKKAKLESHQMSTKVEHAPDPVLQEERKRRKQAELDLFLDKCNQNFRVIIDCNWESEHSDRSMTSLCQQLMYCYGINKKCNAPVHIIFTGVGPKVSQSLAKLKSENWHAVRSYNEEYTDEIDELNGKTLVYLTADSDNLLTDLDHSCAYIIGGIVDRNRLKGATLKKANEQSIRTARLPIKENYNLASSQVLTVNHVFDILVTYNDCKDWKKTLELIIPPRKASASESDYTEGKDMQLREKRERKSQRREDTDFTESQLNRHYSPLKEGFKYGRVIFSKEGEELKFISGQNQPYPFVVGPETIERFQALSGREFVNFLGYENEWLDGKIKEGNRFYLVVFGDVKGLQPIRATWDELYRLVERVSPECFLKICPFIEEMRTKSYDEYEFDIERMDPSEYSKVNSFKSFASSLSPSEVNATYVRAFFRHTLKCTKLFRGDGYTYDERGVRGADEYLINRMSMSDLTDEDPILLDLSRR